MVSFVRDRRRAASSGAAALTALFALLAVASATAAGLSVSITSPADGVWTALDHTLVSGTASGASPDRHQLDTDADFGGGQFVNTTNQTGLVRHNISAAETYHYYQDFTGLAGANSIDEHWMWNLTGTWWEVHSSSGLTDSPPSLAKSNQPAQSVFWNALLPGAALDARVSFRYSCEANAAITAWVSVDGNLSAAPTILSATNVAQTLLTYNLSSFLAGRDSIYVVFQVSASSAAFSFCAIDDFDFHANFTRAPLHTIALTDNFGGGMRAGWTATEGLWGVVAVPSVSDTAPALAHQGTQSTSAWANWGAASNITVATLSFHYQCEANGSVQAYLSRDGSTETRILSGARGAPHTVFNYNATALLAGQKGIFLRFAADATAMPDFLCGIDDFVLTVQVAGHLNLTYTGAYTSPIVDLSYVSTLSAVDWAATTPANTSVSVEFRASPNNITFSAWATVTAPGAAPATASGRFVQFRASFASRPGLLAAALDWVAVNYSAVALVEWSVNGVTWYPANGTANWSADVPLAGGSNNITVRAFDTTGALSAAVVRAMRDTYAPTAPGKPAAAPVTNQSDLTWTWAPATDLGLGLDHYLVDVGLTAGGTELGADLNVTAAQYTVAGLPDGVRVFARVRAVDAAGIVGPYSPNSDATLVDRTAPGPVSITGPGPFANVSSLNWSWDQGADVGSGVASYLVRLGTFAGASDVLSIATANRDVSYAGALSGSSYFVTVMAVDGAGNVGSPATSSGTKVDLDAPAAPSAVLGPDALTNSTTLTWSWTAPVDPLSGISRYEVRVGTTPGASDVVLLPWTTTLYSLGFAASGSTFHFAVRATDGAGNTGPLAFAPGVLVDATPPGVPVVQAVANYVSNASQRVQWSAPPDLPTPGGSGVGGYFVRVDVGGVLTQTSVLGTSTTISLLDGMQYAIFVSAVDRAGNVGGEASVTFTADLSGPVMPTDLKVVITDPAGPSFTASWNGSGDLVSGLREYRISVGTTAGGSDVVSGSLVSGTTYSWTGELGTAYFVTVWGVDNLGNVGPSASTDQGVTANKPSTGGGFIPGMEAAVAVTVLGALAIAAARGSRGSRRP